METSKDSQALKPGTNLDDRYKIIRVLGVGGFGITYEAMNQRIHLRVAIKELFCRSYMVRQDDETSVSVCEKNDGRVCDSENCERNLERLKRDKSAFLREARIVGNFESEPGIVHVLDYFEANETAYIVMEFLDGITLRDYQMRHGVFKTDDIIEKMLPVMESLIKIHEAGVLHRDISPDNIMLMKDGSLKLMDFGSATVLSSERNYGAVEGGQVKDGYAPLEQYGYYPIDYADSYFKNQYGRNSENLKEKTEKLPEQKEKQELKEGPWTDVYAMAATIYTCITGIIPPSALYRSIYDELKKPSELAVHIHPRLEQILMKAMAIRPEKRIQSVTDFHDSLLPSLPSARRKKRRKKRRIILTAFLVAAAIGIIGVLGYVRTHEAEIKFHGKPSETIWISAPDDMSANDFFRNEKILRDRLNFWLGKNNYIWKGSNGKITVMFPSEKLEGQDINTVAEQYLTPSWKMEIQDLCYDKESTTGAWEDTGQYLKKGDLSNFHLEKKDKKQTQEGQYKGKISEDLQEKVNDINADIGIAESDKVWNRLLYTEDLSIDPGKGIITANLDKIPENLRKLVLFEISQTPMTADLVCDTAKKVAWNDLEEQSSSGKFEKNASSIDQDPIILKYGSVSAGYSANSISAGEKIEIVTVLRNRLDALKKLYAIGNDPDDKGIIYVKMARKDISSATAELLPCNFVLNGSGADSKQEYDLWFKDELKLLENNKDENVVQELKVLAEALQRENLLDSSGQYELQGVYKNYDAEHLGKRTSITNGRFSYRRLFDKFEKVSQSLGGKTWLDEKNPFSLNLRIEFDDLKKDRLDQEMFSLLIQILHDVNLNEWTQKTGAVSFVFSDGVKKGNSIYVVLQREKTDQEEPEFSCEFVVNSWKKNNLREQIEKTLKKEELWKKIECTVRVHEIYTLAKS